MSARTMDLDELTRLIDRHGAKPADWPEDRRPAALALLTRSPQALGLVQQAQTLEALLRTGPTPDVVDRNRADRVLRRTLAAARRLPPPSQGLLRRLDERMSAWLGGGWLRYGVPMTVGALLGIVVGQISLPLNGLEADSANGLSSLLGSSIASGWFGS